MIRYYGWLGKNNIGDEAIYLANRQLFPGRELIDYDSVDASAVPIGLFGGGTTMPSTTWNFDDLPANGQYAAIGIGVKDPLFWNRSWHPIDIGYHMGQRGYGELTRNRYFNYLSKPFLRLSDSISMVDHYIGDDDFDPLLDFTHVGVRGPRSERVLNEYGVPSKVVGDTALVLKPSEYVPENTGRIAVTLRGGGPKWDNDTSYRDIILQFCRDNSDEFKFVFLPFHPSDVQLHLEAAKSIDNADFNDYCTHVDVRALLDEIANCDLMIGERLHASILAACAYTPFLSLEYQPKNDDFVQSIAMAEYNTRTHRLSREWLEAKFDKIVSSNSLRDDLADEVGEKRSTLESFSTEIVQSFDRN